MNPSKALLLTAFTLMLISLPEESRAATFTYANVDPAGVLDTVLPSGVPARLITVTTDDLVLQGNTTMTINVSFQNDQLLVVSPAGGAGLELLNLAFVSPDVNGPPPTATMSGTVSVAANGDFLPGSNVPTSFSQSFVQNSPFTATDVILLQLLGNLTDTGYAIDGLQYQIDIPSGFADYATTGINLLISGSSFAVVPIPGAIFLFISALSGLVLIRVRRAAQ